MTPDRLLSALLDPARLRVAGALVDAPAAVEELVIGTGTERRVVLEAIGSLREVGLVEEHAGRFAIDSSTLRRLARERSASPEVDPHVRRGMSDAEAVVLGRFFTGRTLAEIPAARSNRRVVLERLALEFEIGRRYPETEVNEALRAYHHDYVTLRRYLVDEELLDRERNHYWRSGGRTD